jgi:hypothetical protein
VTTTRPTILDAMADPAVFGPWFTPPSPWRAWQGFLAALFALPMDETLVERYRIHTSRQAPPARPAREGWLVVGRRGGKSRIAALVAVYLATLKDYRALLAPGERAVVMVIAADRRQARVVFRYIAGLLDGVPMLRALIERRTQEALHLSNRLTIEVHTASFRSTRGYTVVAAICDEIAFWRTDDSSANPDDEIINAIRPAMATVPGALLLAISSPYARRGMLWKAFQEHYGREDDPVLVWRADTRAMNPLVPEAVIRAAYEDDPAAAAAEYGAEFRSDIAAFVPRETVESCVVPGRRELPPVPGLRYTVFVDPSGGSQDSMALAIAHAEDKDTLVLDLVRERKPPFSPDDVVEQFAGLCRSYRVTTVYGDRYAGEWPRERFRTHGIPYKVVEQTKSELYQAVLPLLTGQRAELLDEPRLIRQLCGLERLTSRAGRDSISHPPGGHDDVANAAAGALVMVGKRGRPLFSEYAPSAGGGRPTWSAADIARFTREAGGEFLGLPPSGWGGWPR